MKWIGYLGTAVLTVSFTLTPAPAESGIYPPQTINAVHHPNQDTPVTVDAAVTNITGPTTEVEPGAAVFINVTIANHGSGAATFDYRLRLNTSETDVNGDQLTLDPGATTTLNLQWNTGSTAPGEYLLAAQVYLQDDQVPDNDSLTMTTPVTIKADPIKADPNEADPHNADPQITFGGYNGVETPDAFLFGTLSPTPEELSVAPEPVKDLFISSHAVKFQSGLYQPNIESNGSALQKIFVANADATFGTSNSLEDPFQNGEVRGTVLLDYQSSSLGAYLAAGDLIFFANPDGSFHGMVPAGTLDLEVRAPGFLPVVMPGVSINPGETLTLPQVTLPFGDGDSDGHINIVDFAVVARNYGFTVHRMDPPGR